MSLFTLTTLATHSVDNVHEIECIGYLLLMIISYVIILVVAFRKFIFTSFSKPCISPTSLLILDLSGPPFSGQVIVG